MHAYTSAKFSVSVVLKNPLCSKVVFDRYFAALVQSKSADQFGKLVTLDMAGFDQFTDTQIVFRRACLQRKSAKIACIYGLDRQMFDQPHASQPLKSKAYRQAVSVPAICQSLGARF